MSETSVAHGIISKDRLEQFAETFASKSPSMDNPLVEEAKIHMDSDGFHITAVDAANVCMVGPVDFAPRGFEHYESSGRATVGINLVSLIDRLDPAPKDALVEFTLDMETRKLRLSYDDADLTLRLIDPDTVRSEPDPADLDLPNTVTLTGERLNYATEITDMVSDHLFVEGRPDDREIVFRGQGDVDDATVSYSDEGVIDAKVNEAVESVYSLDYMKALVKPIPDDAEVTLRFGNEFPLKVSWESFDGALEVRETLAPRIQSE